jgi:hypothetical protein
VKFANLPEAARPARGSKTGDHCYTKKLDGNSVTVRVRDSAAHTMYRASHMS